MKIVQKPLHLNFQKFTFMPSLQIWYTWVDLEHQVSVGISERTPQSASSSYRCKTYAGLVLWMWIRSHICHGYHGLYLWRKSLWRKNDKYEAWCGFPISHHHRTPGEAVGAIMERSLGEESTITNVSGLTLATRWHHIISQWCSWITNQKQSNGV